MKLTLKHLKQELMSFCLTKSKKVMTLVMSKPNVRNLSTTSGTMGQWSSGYDVALTTRRSHVQFLPGPLYFLK